MTRPRFLPLLACLVLPALGLLAVELEDASSPRWRAFLSGIIGGLQLMTLLTGDWRTFAALWLLAILLGVRAVQLGRKAAP